MHFLLMIKLNIVRSREVAHLLNVSYIPRFTYYSLIRVVHPTTRQHRLMLCWIELLMR